MGRRSLPFAMSLAEARDIAGVLGEPSKLPGFAYGISAKLCHRGAELRKIPGSVCSGCYAMNDFYATWKPVQIGHAKRFTGLQHPRWADALVRMIDHYCVPPDAQWFRWHDSGDLQGVWHLKRIVEVVARTPTVRHWMPTREYGYVDSFLAAGGVVPPNLVIRLSAEMIDSEPTFYEAYPRLAQFPSSTVQSAPASSLGMVIGERKGWIECRAVETRDNTCGNCRACWDPRVPNISYPQH